MIYLNYDLYNLNTDESYLELKDYCEELGYPIILKRNPSFTKRVRKVGKNKGFKTHIPPKFFDYNATERAAGGSKSWRYSLYPIKKDKKGYPEFEGDHGEFFNTLDIIFKEEDLEKLWFLMTKSNLVTGRKVYTILDKEKDYRNRVSEKSNAIGVEFFIMNEHSPLSESKLRVIAKYFGMTGVNDLSKAKMQTMLLERIESIERSKKNGYQRFMEATKLDKLVSFKAKLQDAIDSQVVGWIPRSLSWYWLDSTGKPLTSICQITAADEKNKVDILMDFILGSEELTNRFNRELTDEPIITIDFDEVKILKDKDDGGYSYGELTALSKVIPGFNPVAKKYGVIVEELKNFHNVI